MKIHKLTKKEAQKICETFGLGKLNLFEPFSEGLINSNYKVKTSQGKFVFRLIGTEIDKRKRDMLLLERKVLLYLTKEGFPYETPCPLMNKNKKYLSKINGKSYWVYKLLKGKTPKRDLNNKKLKEIARAMAVYHKFMRNFKTPRKKGDFSLDWFMEKYSSLEKKLAKMKKGNRTDKLVKKNFPLFNRLMHKLSKMDFLTDVLVAHGDMHYSNLLFEKDKLIGIIDFDNLKVAPRTEDVAYTLRLSSVGTKGLDRRRMNLFLKEYEKIKKLSKKEKRMLIPLMIRGNAIVFWWMYEDMKKGLDKKYDMIKWTIDITKVLVKEWKKIK